jgi:hypothetical protein
MSCPRSALPPDVNSFRKTCAIVFDPATLGIRDKDGGDKCVN